MITRAIVEEVISPYEVRVRIPILDRVETSSLYTPTEELNIATVCTMPNCYINPQIGDIVFVGFEDNTYYRAVILGHLSKELITSYPDISCYKLDCKTSAVLPSETMIGNVTAQEISTLAGCNHNVQIQLNDLQNQINHLRSIVEQTK